MKTKKVTSKMCCTGDHLATLFAKFVDFVWGPKILYRKLFPGVIEMLQKELKNCETVLDLGCGPNSKLQYVKGIDYSVGVDIHRPYVNQSKEKGIHNAYWYMNVLEIEKWFCGNQFDAVLCLDVMEHLDNEEEGFALIKMMEHIARKKVIILTPNGYLHQPAYDNNPYQEHKTAWLYYDFHVLDYKVSGVNGLKWLKSNHAKPRFEPYWFWNIVSDITQKFVKHWHSFAFQLWAVKEIK